MMQQARKIKKIRQNDLLQGYSYLHELGQGSDGVVGLCQKDGKHYAVKKILSSDQQFEVVQRLAGYVGATDYLVLPFDRHQRKTYSYLYYEWYTCDLYTRRFQYERRLSSSQKLSILWRILETIKWMHGNGICHRDIRMQNFLWSDHSGSIKMSDFGRVRFLQDTSPMWIFSRYLNEDIWLLGRLIINLFGDSKLQRVRQVEEFDYKLDPVISEFIDDYKDLGKLAEYCFQLNPIETIFQKEQTQLLSKTVSRVKSRMRNIKKARKVNKRNRLKIVKHRR